MRYLAQISVSVLVILAPIASIAGRLAYVKRPFLVPTNRTNVRGVRYKRTFLVSIVFSMNNEQ